MAVGYLQGHVEWLAETRRTLPASISQQLQSLDVFSRQLAHEQYIEEVRWRCSRLIQAWGAGGGEEGEVRHVLSVSLCAEGVDVAPRHWLAHHDLLL